MGLTEVKYCFSCLANTKISACLYHYLIANKSNYVNVLNLFYIHFGDG